MKCNLLRYIEEQAVTCVRIARSCDEGSESRTEWQRTVEVLMERRKEHVAVCKKCKARDK